MLKPTIIAAVVAIGLSAPTSAAARTTTISHVYEYGLGPSNIPFVGSGRDNVTYVVPAFDPSLGTLLGVGYEVVAHSELGVTWVATKPGFEVFGGVGQRGGEGFTWLQGWSDPFTGSSLVLPDAAGQVFDVFPAPKSGRRELRARWVSAGYLSLTEGGAENFQGDALVIAEFSEYLGAYFDLGDIEVFDVTTSAEHRLAVTYYYDDGTVPEPRSWALVITGLGAAGATLRRQRASGRELRQTPRAN